jgi:hypothetical protein
MARGVLRPEQIILPVYNIQTVNEEIQVDEPSNQ